MIYAAIILGLCQIFAAVTTVVLFRRILDRKQAEISEQIEAAIREWIEPGPDNTASKLASTVDMVGAVVGSAAARSIMAHLKQENAAVANVANGISDRIQGQTNPLMALLSGGKRGKGAAVQRLTEMLMPLFAGGLGGGGGAGNGSSQKSELQKRMRL